MKVLHLDSDPNSLRRLRGDALRSVGLLCDLEQVTSIEESLQRMAEARFDVVLADYSNSQNWGETCRALEGVTPSPPLVALANTVETDQAIQAVLDGAEDLVAKTDPEPNWLMRRIRFAVERAGRKQARVAAPHVQHAAAHAPVSVGAGNREGNGRNHLPLHATLHPSDHASNPPTVERSRPFSFSPHNTIQVLHVEDDQMIARIVKKCLSANTSYRIEVTHHPTWNDARDCLRENSFDAVLLDLTLPDRQDLDCLYSLLPHVGETPLLVLSGRDEDSFALEALRTGADDFLVKGEHTTKYLAQAVLMSMARRSRSDRNAAAQSRRAGPQEHAAGGATHSETHTGAAPRPTAGHHDRRKHARYLLTRPVYVIPIRPDRGLGETHTADGITVDVSLTGVKFEVAGIDRLPTKHLLLGVEDQSGGMHFATLESRHVVSLPGRLSIGGEFVFDSRDLIRRANLEPTFNPQSRGFETGLSVEVLARWCELGIFRPILVDRVMLCPQCHGVATFRKGCRVCGSVRLHSRPLIHHFACAHVGFVGDFEQEGTVVCPKCRTKNMIVGADYEHLSGPFRCVDCDWSDTELDLVGQCLRCELRFPAAQAVEEDLIGYHVERLDPLALINAT